MQPSLSYNTMIVASKSFCLYIHNSQSSRMRAVSQWFFSINQASQSVQRACLRSVNKLPALSQSRPRGKGLQTVQRAISQASAFQYSSSLGMLSSYSFASLSIWFHSGHSIDTLGFVQKRWTDKDWLIAIGEMNQFSSICLSWFNSGNVLNSCCQSQLEYTLSIGYTPVDPEPESGREGEPKVA